jgi:hypothetical protein
MCLCKSKVRVAPVIVCKCKSKYVILLIISQLSKR